ncbi:hypothetical protein ACRRTK_004558 [Alexandromys fortis]
MKPYFLQKQGSCLRHFHRYSLSFHMPNDVFSVLQVMGSSENLVLIQTNT